MSDLEPFFNSAEECAAYETFCAEQERGEGVQIESEGMDATQMDVKRKPV